MTSPSMIPQRPSALKDDIPLPFAVWRVLNLVNGQRTLEEIASTLNLSVDQVNQALDQAQSWIGRAVQREQVVAENTIDTVSQCLVSVVGPVGEFIVDDALEEVGKNPTLAQVLSAIAPQLSEQHLQAFVRQLRSKGLA